MFLAVVSSLTLVSRELDSLGAKVGRERLYIETVKMAPTGVTGGL